MKVLQVDFRVMSKFQQVGDEFKNVKSADNENHCMLFSSPFFYKIVFAVGENTL